MIRPLTLKRKMPNPSHKPWLDNAAGRAFVSGKLNGNMVSTEMHPTTDPFPNLGA
jgi:hypothetical protein